MAEQKTAAIRAVALNQARCGKGGDALGGADGFDADMAAGRVVSLQQLDRLHLAVTVAVAIDQPALTPVTVLPA